jgi:hypothetical protein
MAPLTLKFRHQMQVSALFEAPPDLPRGKKLRVSLNVMLDGPSEMVWTVLEKRNLPPLPRLVLQTVQPVASCYTD